MAHRKVELELEQFGALRQVDPQEAAKALRKGLADRLGVIVAKAAKVTGEMGLRELIPDLLRAYDRVFEDAVTRDPQCNAKNAIARALRDMEHRESAPFVRGAKYIQMEPSFGRPVDTAVTLRGICLLSLPACTDLRRVEIMRFLVDAFADEEAVVRVEAARGLEVMEGDDSTLLLRLKARIGDGDAAVIGQVFDSLLKIEGAHGVPFVAGYLSAPPEIRHEAALALGTSRLPAGVEVLQKAWETARKSEFREVILRAMGISRQERAYEFLLGVIRDGRTLDAQGALEALAFDRKSPEIRRQAEAAAAEGGPAIHALFAQIFA